MNNPVIPESLGFFSPSPEKLSEKEQALLALVHEHWPTSALELAAHSNEIAETREQKKQLSTKYSYYLKKLVEKRFLFSKRIGNALIVWPVRAEKYRTVHRILADEWQPF